MALPLHLTYAVDPTVIMRGTGNAFGSILLRSNADPLPHEPRHAVVQ